MEYRDKTMGTNCGGNGTTLETVLGDAVEGRFVLDRDRRIVSFSRGCERITGYSGAEMLGTTCPEAAEGRDDGERTLASMLCPARPVLNGEVPSSRQRMQIRHRSGRQVWVDATYLPMHDADSRTTCIVCVMREVTQNVSTGGDAGYSTQAAALDTCGDAAVSSIKTSAGAEAAGEAATAVEDGEDILDHILHRVEKREILGALRRSRGQRSRAARTLGISRSRLYRRMEALGIDPRVDV